MLIKGASITKSTKAGTGPTMRPVKVTDEGWLFEVDTETGQLKVGTDGTDPTILKTNSDGELIVEQANLFAGEDPVNDFRKVKKDDLGTYSPAGTEGTTVDGGVGAATVLASVDMLGYPNFTVYVVNAGGGDGDNLDEVQVQVSPDDSTFVSIDTDGGLALASAGMHVMQFSDQAVRYVRVIASCAGADDTTVDCYITANRG